MTLCSYNLCSLHAFWGGGSIFTITIKFQGNYSLNIHEDIVVTYDASHAGWTNAHSFLYIANNISVDRLFEAVPLEAQQITEFLNRHPSSIVPDYVYVHGYNSAVFITFLNSITMGNGKPLYLSNPRISLDNRHGFWWFLNSPSELNSFGAKWSSSSRNLCCYRGSDSFLSQFVTIDSNNQFLSTSLFTFDYSSIYSKIILTRDYYFPFVLILHIKLDTSLRLSHANKIGMFNIINVWKIRESSIDTKT
jgi:hypothetical protein